MQIIIGKERETFCGRLRKRTPFLRWRTQLHRIREKALRDESLETNTARDLEQVVQNPSLCEGFGCGHYNFHKRINTIRHCHIHFSVSTLNLRTQLQVPPLPFSPISITIELTRKRSFSYAQESCSRL